ncbi:MAG: dockerin type I repeat-containing protein [Oscillospiraceae bacterium]|nr:dockerin type I repeat-containing protein [Oscillospiraceae bacterium]
MRKQLFAALTAAVLFCGAWTVPAAAKTKYRKGDVNRDGDVAVDDAQLALKEYVYYGVAGKEHVLDEEQRQLADIDGDGSFSHDGEPEVTAADAAYILAFYTNWLANPAQRSTDIEEWIRARFRGYAAR